MFHWSDSKVPEKIGQDKRGIKVGLLGASFDTGNLGVSTLAESSVKAVLHRWPDAEIIFLGSGYVPGEQRLSLMGREVCIRTLPIRFCKNIFMPYHFLKYVFYGFLSKVLRKLRLSDKLLSRNQYFKTFYEIDIVADITGGDSFSDIYGTRRFFLGFLNKWVAVFLGKRLIMLPQTYGPFKKSMTEKIAKYILKRCDLVYSRDKAGVEYVRKLLKNRVNGDKIRFAPDVGFILDAHRPDDFDGALLSKMSGKKTITVGLNISGLLFNGGYSRNNMFGLKTDYRNLVHRIVELFLAKEGVVVVLVPHVFPPAGYEVESDPAACRSVYEAFGENYRDRLFLVDSKLNHNQIKYIIGLCDFFVGSRMHSCIAAISQCVASAGLAYSDKFRGVFEIAGVGDYVADMRYAREDEILAFLEKAFEFRKVTAAKLKKIVPLVQRRVESIFDVF
jgi:polysaccharide pyruvyl transferase WcaK-like protein